MSSAHSSGAGIGLTAHGSGRGGAGARSHRGPAYMVALTVSVAAVAYRGISRA